MRNRLSILFFIFIFSFHQYSFSQTFVIDSIQDLLSNTQHDTSKIALLNELSLLLFNTDPTEALLLAEKSQLISDQENYFVHQTRTNNAMAASNWLLGNYKVAVEYVHKNIAIYEKDNNQKELANSYHHLSVILLETSQLNSALEYSQMAIKISSENSYKSILARAESAAANMYITLHNDYKSAELAYNNALQIYTKLEDTLKIGITKNNLGLIYSHEKQYDKALEAYKKALDICIKYRSNDCICSVLINIGKTYSVKKQYNQARYYYQQSLDTSTFYKLRELEISAYWYLAVVDSIQYNYLASIGNFQKYYDNKISNLLKEEEDRISELQIKYETDKQKQENALLKKNERIQILVVRLLVGAILFILIILILLWRLLRIKQKNNSSLSIKNEEITKQNNEIHLQKETVQEQSKELFEYKEQLEKLVKKRTLELSEAKEHAEESDRLKSAFLNNISHEFRTPMNGILGFANLLVDEGISNEESKEHIRFIRKSCNKLLNMVDDTVEVSKIHTKQEEILKSQVNIKEVLLSVLSNYSDEIKNKSLQLEVEMDCNPEQLIILTDKNKITRIFGHLIDNAIKFTHHGFVSIYCKTVRDDFLQFHIKDSGIGVSRKLIERVFESFRQEEPSPTRNYGGSGIGLTLVKSYVELLNGKVWLESEEGKGTSVYFTIPLELSHVKTPIRKPKDTQILEEKTILIVEDDELNYILIDNILSRYKCQILHAWNGKEAVDYFMDNNQIDLILMDLRMPVLDGYMASKLIKDIDPNIPIISLSAYANDSKGNDTAIVKFDGSIIKPIDPQKFIDEIMRHI